jgi:hypothetical protein
MLLTAILIFAGMPLSTMPARAAEEPRTWASQDGKHKTEAGFVGFSRGKVRLLKTDGKTIDVPLGQLSEEDQDYVAQVAEDDATSVQALQQQEIEVIKNKAGRVEEVSFPRSGRITRRHVEWLSGLPNLQRLNLVQVRLSEGALEGIAGLGGLRQLDLTATGIGTAEVRGLVALKRLEGLNLSDTQITNRALSYLKELPKLTELALANTRIADDGIAHLEALKQLKKLNLSNTRVSPQAVLRLRKALPNTSMEGSGVVRR